MVRPLGGEAPACPRAPLTSLVRRRRRCAAMVRRLQGAQGSGSAVSPGSWLTFWSTGAWRTRSAGAESMRDSDCRACLGEAPLAEWQ